MTLHKLAPERQPPEPRHINVGVSFQHELYNLADTVVNTRALQAFEMAVTNHPIHRIVRCAVHRKLERVFDDIDEALLRPGRCFATVRTCSLTREEGARLAGPLCKGDTVREHAALASVFVEGVRTASVAAIYRACAAALASGRQPPGLSH
jgi:hypothetical protein